MGLQDSDSRFAEIEDMVDMGRYDEARAASMAMIKYYLEAIRYLDS